MHNQKLITFFILILNIPAAMSIDEHAASLPAMAQELNSTAALMQMTITLYMLGMALSQWLCGILSDRFGRRPILLINAVIYLLATLLCIFSSDFSEILIGRFFQGIGTGIFAMISPALMSEALEEKRVGKVSSYFSMSYALIPILAPVIGGYIQGIFNWQANFVFMFLVMLIIALFCLLKFPETHKPTEEHRLHIPKLFRSYTKVLSTRAYITSVFALIFAWSMIITFSVLGPFLLQETLHLSPIAYGHFALLVGLGFLVGNFLNTILLKRVGVRKLILAGLWVNCALSLIQLVFILGGDLTLFTVMAPTFLLMVMIGMVFPSLYGTAATACKEHVGIASSLIGCLILLGAVILTGIMSLLKPHEASVLPTVFLALSVLCLVSFYTQKADRFKKS